VKIYTAARPGWIGAGLFPFGAIHEPGSSLRCESPPACSPVGSSRPKQAVAVAGCCRRGVLVGLPGLEPGTSTMSRRKGHWAPRWNTTIHASVTRWQAT